MTAYTRGKGLGPTNRDETKSPSEPAGTILAEPAKRTKFSGWEGSGRKNEYCRLPCEDLKDSFAQEIAVRGALANANDENQTRPRSQQPSDI
ncbi:hypothetical protein TWF506_004301 [Arthrobotrys conoides]|uniref:Uncharacterized protein n=1 Tax=Arthrobotrys conoides TaxID=74498 RepID=A0AAN8N2X8_9PEZI